MKIYDMDRLRQTVILTLIFALVLMIPTLLTLSVPKANETFLNILLGWFVAKGSDAVAFLINTTDRSQAKDQAIANVAGAVAAQASAATTLAAGVATDAAAAAPAAAPDGSATLTVTPPASIEIKETPDAPQPDAPGGTPEPASVPQAPGLQPGDRGPPE